MEKVFLFKSIKTKNEQSFFSIPNHASNTVQKLVYFLLHKNIENGRKLRLLEQAFLPLFKMELFKS